jgi:hypothetical protein
VKPSFKLSWEPLIFQQNIYRRKIHQELTEFVPATRMGIVRKVLLGLTIRAGCIFSLLLDAFEWRLRFKI